MIDSGSLSRRVQVLRATLIDDGFTRRESFETYGQPISAAKRDISDGERLQAAQIGATVTARFVIRRNSFTRTITAKDRLQCEAREYDITGIKDLEPDGLEITASVRADAS